MFYFYQIFEPKNHCALLVHKPSIHVAVSEVDDTKMQQVLDWIHDSFTKKKKTLLPAKSEK